MTKTEKNQSADERKARARFIDQPGQWTDTTPANVKKRQEKAWSELLKATTPTKKKK